MEKLHHLKNRITYPNRNSKRIFENLFLLRNEAISFVHLRKLKNGF